MGAPCFCFFAQCVNAGNPKNVSVQLPGQSVVLQNDIECLVPRHVIEHDGQVSLHLRIQHDIQAANFVNEAEEVFQINILQVY